MTTSDSDPQDFIIDEHGRITEIANPLAAQIMIMNSLLDIKAQLDEIQDSLKNMKFHTDKMELGADRKMGGGIGGREG